MSGEAELRINVGLKRARIVKWDFLLVLFLALLWPTSGGYYMRVGAAVCVSVIWALRTIRDKSLRQAAYARAATKVKFEN